MSHNQLVNAVDILLIEDNPGDVRLTREAMKEARIAVNLNVANDGLEAMAMLHQEAPYDSLPLPDLILLDLNMPRMDGREVLRLIKSDERLKHIPVVILTTSAAEKDIAQAYGMHANCYITKPVELDQFMEIVKAIEGFWLTVVKLPGNSSQ
ncbi:MAG: response regulator [Betaproteobacteria bacterium]|nr:response regulator [Betaproteobacteria bacterium]